MDVTDDCPTGAWDAYVSEHSDTFLFHTSAWRRAIEHAMGHRTWYLAAVQGSDVKGVLPLIQLKSRLFGNLLCSLPYVTTGGLCADGDEARDALTAAAIELGNQQGVDRIEFRQNRPVIPGLTTRSHKVTMPMELAASADEMFGELRSEIRNRIRKAQRQGLEVQVGGGDALSDFYRCYSVNMRDLGTPVYGRRFFESQFEELGEHLRIVRVFWRGRVIGAGIMAFFRDRVEMPWVASMRKYFELAPNNLLYWESIVYAIEEGASVFDFGRSTRDSGTYTFKKRWGAEPHALAWQYWTPEGKAVRDISPDNASYGLAIKVWQKLPVHVSSVLGPPVVKYIP